MSNLYGYLAIAGIVGLFCLLLSLSFHRSQVFRSTDNLFSEGPIPNRFKRFATAKDSAAACPNAKPVSLSDSLILKSMNLYFKGDDVENVVRNKIRHRMSTKELIKYRNEHSKYAKLVDNYPALSFSINLPEFDCMLNSTLSHYIKQVESLYLNLKSDNISHIQIVNIPTDKVIDFVSQIFLIFDLLRNSSQKSRPTKLSFALRGEHCHFTVKCHFLLRHFHDKKYVASLYFTKLNNGTSELSPQIESFQPEFLSLQANSIDFNITENIILENSTTPDSLHHIIYDMKVLKEAESGRKVRELIKKLTADKSYLPYRIFKGEFSPKEGNFLFDIEHRQKEMFFSSETNYYEIENTLQQRKDEYFYSTQIHCDFYEISQKNSTMVSISSGTASSIHINNTTYFKALDNVYSDYFSIKSKSLLLTKASDDAVEITSSANEHSLNEFKKKEVLFAAFSEFTDLYEPFSKEFQQKFNSDMKTK